jgi:D-serine deaminase-like pyridoxal phosphate-dependent protein
LGRAVLYKRHIRAIRKSGDRLAFAADGEIVDWVVVMRRFPDAKLSTLVDDAANLATISRTASAENIVLPLYVDINVGMNRTGILPGPAALQLYRDLCKAPGVRAAGLHGYDGHLRAADPKDLEAMADQAFAPVWAMREQLLGEGLPVPNMVVSGTPTFALMAQKGGVEVGAGTTVLWSDPP